MVLDDRVPNPRGERLRRDGTIRDSEIIPGFTEGTHALWTRMGGEKVTMTTPRSQIIADSIMGTLFEHLVANH